MILQLFYIILRLLRPSFPKRKLFLNDGLAMTRPRKDEEETNLTASRHCEACRIDCRSLLNAMASRSKLNFITNPSCHVEPLTIFIYKLEEIKTRHLTSVDL